MKAFCPWMMVPLVIALAMTATEAAHVGLSASDDGWVAKDSAFYIAPLLGVIVVYFTKFSSLWLGSASVCTQEGMEAYREIVQWINEVIRRL